METNQIHSENELNRQIRELERDKRIEEIRQLRNQAKRSWITPAAVTALLPLLGGFFLWVYGEVKQFNQGFRALKERDQLKQEKLELERQKSNLNIEISTLLDLKNHYEDEAKRLLQEQDTLKKENVTLSADRKKLEQQRDKILEQQKQLREEYEALTELLKNVVDAPGLPKDQHVYFVREIRRANLRIETINRIILQDSSRVDPSTKRSSERLEDIKRVYGQIVRDKTIITIPLVIHVVYRTDEENISDNQIKSQLRVLNEDFRAKNSDLAKVPEPFKEYIGDAHIEFALADRDPDGNPTDGIVRVKTTVSGFGGNDTVKSTKSGGSNPWQTDKYLNIWVCALRGGLLQFSQFPGGPDATDGVVVHHQAFGTTGTVSAPFNKGRSLTSGVARYLNIRRIWGDDGIGCTGSDYIADTPNQAGPNFGKPTFPKVSCNNGPHGDMFMNFADYVDDDSMYMFTKGQVVRMHETLGGPRSSLGIKRTRAAENADR